LYTVESLWDNVKQAFKTPPRDLARVVKERWFFEADDGSTKGPFKPWQMWHKNAMSQFHADQLVKRSNWAKMYSIQQLWPSDQKIAFAVPPVLPPGLEIVEEEQVAEKTASGDETTRTLTEAQTSPENYGGAADGAHQYGGATTDGVTTDQGATTDRGTPSTAGVPAEHEDDEDMTTWVWYSADEKGKETGPYKSPQLADLYKKGQMKDRKGKALQVRRAAWHHTYDIDSLWDDLKNHPEKAFTTPPRLLSDIHHEEEMAGKRRSPSSSGKSLKEIAHNWYYESDEGDIQGPFKNLQMCEWSLAGNLPPSLLVRRADWNEQEFYYIELLWGDHKVN